MRLVLKVIPISDSHAVSFTPRHSTVLGHAKEEMVTNSRIRFFNIYLLPSILFVTSYIVFGFYYGTSDDATVEALIRGVFFSHPITEFFAFHRITAVLYAHLYQLSPDIPWYGIFMHGLLLLAITNYFALIHRHGEKIITNCAVLTPLLIVFYLVFFLDGVIFITYTKVAILLAASSVLLIIDGTLKTEESQRPPYWQLGGYFFLFLVGFLTRPQAGILCIVLLLPFAILYSPAKRGLSRTFCVFVVLISIVGLLKSYDYVTSSDGSRYYWTVSSYITNLYDYRGEGKNLTEPQDAIKYRAITRGALADRESLSVDFLSRISSNQFIDVSRINARDVQRAVQAMASEISPYYLLIVFAILTAAVVIFVLISASGAIHIAHQLSGV